MSIDKKTHHPEDKPLEELKDMMQDAIRRGATCFFKWTCLGCGERVTADKPNTILQNALHTEKEDSSLCNYTTYTVWSGGGLMLITGIVS